MYFEYISSKENYDRQIKQYNTEESIGLRNQLRIANENLKKVQSELEIISAENASLVEKNAELEKSYADLQIMVEQANIEKTERNAKYLADIEELKRKAQIVQDALDLELKTNDENKGNEEVLSEEKTQDANIGDENENN